MVPVKMQQNDLFQTNLASQEQDHAIADALLLGSRSGQVIHIHYMTKIIYILHQTKKPKTGECKRKKERKHVSYRILKLC